QTAADRTLARWHQLAGPPPAGTAHDDLFDDIVARGAAVPLRRTLVGDSRKALVILMSATSLLLLIASANLAGLLLSDAAARRREMALRAVLGATRGRIIRQLLAESSLLTLAGAVVGVAIAPVVLGALRAMMPSNLSGVSDIALDARVLGFAVALALVTGIVFGLWPAIGVARTDPGETIKSSSGGTTASGRSRTRRLIVTAELALSVMLLVASGLMLRSLQHVLSQNPGFDGRGVGVVELSFARSVPVPERIQQLDAMVARLEHDPAVRAAGAINDLPMRAGHGGGIALKLEPDGGAPVDQRDPNTFVRPLQASRGYFAAAGIPVLRGAVYTPADEHGGDVAIISASTAKLWWPHADPIGKTFRFPFGSGESRMRVVGVVADVRESSLERDPQPQ